MWYTCTGTIRDYDLLTAKVGVMGPHYCSLAMSNQIADSELEYHEIAIKRWVFFDKVKRLVYEINP